MSMGVISVRYTLDLIRGFEEALLNPSVRRSPEMIRELLADDFIEFGRSGGVYTKEDVARSLVAESIDDQESLRAKDFTLRPLAAGILLLTYRSFRLTNGTEHRHTLRSSIWKFIDGRWQMAFHQGTPTDR